MQPNIGVPGRDLSPATGTNATQVTTRSEGSRRRWAYVTGAMGIALLAGGVVAGLQARSAFDDEKSATTESEYDRSRSKSESMSRVADALFVAGGAGVAVGGWLFFTSRPAALALELAPVSGGAVASISGGF